MCKRIGHLGVAPASTTAAAARISHIKTAVGVCARPNPGSCKWGPILLLMGFASFTSTTKPRHLAPIATGRELGGIAHRRTLRGCPHVALPKLQQARDPKL